MLFYSAELRWFIKKKDITAKEWFLSRTGGKNTEPEVRTDHYLATPGNDSVGVKVRDDEFEVKSIIGSSEVYRHGNVSGLVNKWVKWSVGSEHSKGVGAFIGSLDIASSEWIEVSKKRWLQRYSLDKGRVKPADLKEDYPTNGCNLELTEVGMGKSDSSYYSIALEAFGPSPLNCQNNLFKAAENILVGEQLSTLITLNSCAYPTWLAQCADVDT